MESNRASARRSRKRKADSLDSLHIEVRLISEFPYLRDNEYAVPPAQVRICLSQKLINRGFLNCWIKIIVLDLNRFSRDHAY
jgi:hypothetical protein